MRFLGWVPYQGFGTPSLAPAIRNGNAIGHASRGRDRRASSELWYRRIVPSIRESRLGKGAGFDGPISSIERKADNIAVGYARHVRQLRDPVE
jgi:hypothetical protein